LAKFSRICKFLKKCSLAGEEMLQAHELKEEFQRPSDYFKGEEPFRYAILEAKLRRTLRGMCVHLDSFPGTEIMSMTITARGYDRKEGQSCGFAQSATE
jgi:hypothetical protein